MPPAGQSSFSQRKPLARLVISGDAAETILVPRAVARALDTSDEPDPNSRAELLYRARAHARSCAWAKLVDLASRREHSVQEVGDKLRREGYSATCIEEVVGKAAERRILKDARFADAFIRSKLAQGWGPMRIERELSLKGVDIHDVAGWPHDYLDESDIESRAREVLARRPVPAVNAYPKLVRFLASRGYPLGVASSAVKARLAELDDEQ